VFGRRFIVATVLSWVAMFLCLLVLFGANAWLPALMINAGYGVGSAFSFLLVLNLGAAVGTLGASFVADNVGSKPVIAATFLAAAVSLGLLALHPPTIVVYLLVAVAGVGTTGTQILLNAYLGGYYPTRARATGLGLALGIGRLGGVIGPIYGGYILASGVAPEWRFYAFAIPAALGSLVILLVGRRPATSRIPAAAQRFRVGQARP
jgi:AAHS family benzoate transporter-like MFS transporter